MRNVKLAIATLFVLGPMAAQAVPISVEFDFGDSRWSGVASYDAATGQAWRHNRSITAYAISSMKVSLSGIATWDETEITPAWVPNIGGLLVDSFNRVALFLVARDTATGRAFGSVITHGNGRIYRSSIGVNGRRAYYSGRAATAVPEPGTLALFGLGLLGLGLARRKSA